MTKKKQKEMKEIYIRDIVISCNLVQTGTF